MQIRMTHQILQKSVSILDHCAVVNKIDFLSSTVASWYGITLIFNFKIKTFYIIEISYLMKIVRQILNASKHMNIL